MLRSVIVALFALALLAGPAWAVHVGHDCAEGADEYIIADTKDKPKLPAGV